MTSFCSTALVFNPSTMTCDVAIATNGQPVIDFTPATPLLISIGCDRRAQPDDALPFNAGPSNADAGSPLPFNPRRGWPGDALDTQGQLTGSALWLLHRAKRTDVTRQLAIASATAATAWIETQYGCAVEVDAEWIGRVTLGLGVRVDKAQALTLPMVVS